MLLCAATCRAGLPLTSTNIMKGLLLEFGRCGTDAALCCLPDPIRALCLRLLVCARDMQQVHGEGLSRDATVSATSRCVCQV